MLSLDSKLGFYWANNAKFVARFIVFATSESCGTTDLTRSSLLIFYHLQSCVVQTERRPVAEHIRPNLQPRRSVPQIYPSRAPDFALFALT